MKNLHKILLLVFIIIAFTSVDIFAQIPNPPSAPNHNTTDNTDGNGGGAPIGSGLFILLGLGAAYGGIKTYQFYQKKKKSLLD